MFIDEAKICVVSGRGGHGCISFFKQKHQPKGRPSGGDGGRGGDVVLVASPRMRTLLAFRKKIHWKAENGGHGGSNRRRGRRGRDCVVKLPVGTVVKDLRTQEVLADLTVPGQCLVIVRGGEGGRGNTHFVSNRRRAPRICETGAPGEERWLKLELKLLADVGLIGLPNAGKSTLLACLSAARPKIAAYPFTTLEPQLGVVPVGPFEEFVAVEVPGLIEGAHRGRGLGDRFLKHVERTRLLMHVVDLASSGREGEGRDPLEDVETVNRELAAFSEELIKKPQLLVGNKADLLTEAELEAQVARFAARGLEILPISAATGRGTKELVRRCAQHLEALRLQAEAETETEARPETSDQAKAKAKAETVTATEPPRRTRRVYRFADEPDWEVLPREDGLYLLRGRALERLGRLRLEGQDALEYLHERLERLGVLEALVRQGARSGDRVRLGRQEFIFSPTRTQGQSALDRP